MSALTVFVPEYVNLDTIDKCFRDKSASFEHVDSATFDVTAQQAVHKTFMFLEKEHFLVYPNEGEPLKFHYQSRNRIMTNLHYRRGCDYLKYNFKEVNGLRMSRHAPIHYFVCSENLDDLHINDVTKNHTIVKYFDSEDVVDLANFAEIVKSKPDCVQKHFIVYKDKEFRAVETDNVENTFVFSLSLENQTVLRLTTGKATIDTFIEEEKNVEDEYANPERQPGFKLRDAKGEIVPDGVTFDLEIIRDPDDYEELSEEEDAEYDEDDRGSKDWVAVNDYKDDGEEDHIFGQPQYGESFECETINGIVYLKCGDGYLYINNDSYTADIFIGEKVPAKDQRLQIHYAKDGNICLTGWGDRNYVSCHWIKCSYGMIGFGGPSTMKLRLVW